MKKTYAECLTCGFSRPRYICLSVWRSWGNRSGASRAKLRSPHRVVNIPTRRRARRYLSNLCLREPWAHTSTSHNAPKGKVFLIEKFAKFLNFAPTFTRRPRRFYCRLAPGKNWLIVKSILFFFVSLQLRPESRLIKNFFLFLFSEA